MNPDSIKKPCLLIDKAKAIKNIRLMKIKAEQNQVIFRPHFKTHQSSVVGDWYKQEGISAITVSSVSISPDLRNAKVFVSSFEDGNHKNDIMAGLAASNSYIRRETASVVKMKNMPELQFVYDDGLERGDRVLSLLNNLNENDPSNIN